VKKFAAKFSKNYILYMVVSVIVITELALDFYLPMLSQIRHEFGASEALIEVTISSYFLGVGISAIVYGNLSDVWGRRKCFLTGIFLFILGTFGCYTAKENVLILICYRFIQGCGSGVAWAIGNATMRDIYSGKEFAGAITLLHLISGMVPVIAPTIGGYIGQEYGWRTAFLSLLITAIALLFIFYWKFKETNQNKQKFSWHKMTNDYLTLLCSANFWQFAIIKVLAVSAIFVELSNITLIFVETYGLSISAAGYYVSAGCIAYVFGGGLSTYLLNYRSSEQLTVLGMILITIGYLLLLVIGQFIELTPLLIQIIKIPAYAGFALLFSNATYCIVSRFSEMAGSASALMITFEMLVSSAGINLLSLFLDGTIRPVAYYALLCMVISICPLFLLNKKQITYS
jgi:DHA1 family bicyclomycin/chloramphenicol resistance-like MFS transporter